jgi:hypothetical protein
MGNKNHLLRAGEKSTRDGDSIVPPDLKKLAKRRKRAQDKAALRSGRDPEADKHHHRQDFL